MVRAFAHVTMGRRIDPSRTNLLSYISFQPVLHDWCNKGCDMYYPVGGMVHIKEPLLLIQKSSPCGDSGFPLSLSEWSFIICLTPYNRKYNVLSASLNKTFPSFSICKHLFIILVYNIYNITFKNPHQTVYYLV